MSSQLKDHRVDAFCDNMAVVQSWKNQGCRDPSFNLVLKDILDFTQKNNVSLHIQFIATSDNRADNESRRITKADANLSESHWKVM